MSFIVSDTVFKKISEKYCTYNNEEDPYEHVYASMNRDLKQKFDIFYKICLQKSKIDENSLSQEEKRTIFEILLQYFLCP